MDSANPYSPPAANMAGPSAGTGAITTGMVEALRKTKGWVLLIGVLCFLAAAFSAVGALGLAVAGTITMGGATKSNLPVGFAAGIAVFYLAFAAVYIFLGIYLVKYANAIGRLVRDGGAEAMQAALESQQKFWRLAGVLVLLMVVVMFVGIAAAVAIPIMSAKG